MDARHLLLAFTLLTHSLTTLMWWAAGGWMGLSRKASKHWMLSSLGYGLGLLLTVTGDQDGSTPQWLMAGVLVVLGGVSLRRGMQAFLKIPHTDQEQLAVALTCISACVGVFMPLGWRHAGMSLCCFSMCWVLGRTAWECFAPIRNEFKVGTAWAHTALMCVALSVFAATGLTMALPQWPWPWAATPPTELHHALMLSSLALSILSSFVLGYIVVMRLVRRLEHLSHHDGLTGLLNRRAIEAQLDREVQRLQRFNEPFSVLLVDIDHFKRINDRLGHAAGDAVLAAVAHTLQAQAREVDRVARYGGEEFCVVLPHTLHEGALQAAERLRLAVSQINVPWGDEHVAVTISTGLVCANATTETLPMLLRRADEALYAAKGAGRNQVVSAPPHRSQA
jgi:diguanylate cyclase (GGDEF)-like protein